ncbi:hypothetical protein HZS_6409 [Henneguya salminicola]|nr:hypothetical protein HZS_6409 [Henneguya salminicola]
MNILEFLRLSLNSNSVLNAYNLSKKYFTIGTDHVWQEVCVLILPKKNFDTFSTETKEKLIEIYIHGIRNMEIIKKDCVLKIITPICETK